MTRQTPFEMARDDAPGFKTSHSRNTTPGVRLNSYTGHSAGAFSATIDHSDDELVSSSAAGRISRASSGCLPAKQAVSPPQSSDVAVCRLLSIQRHNQPTRGEAGGKFVGSFPRGLNHLSKKRHLLGCVVSRQVLRPAPLQRPHSALGCRLHRRLDRP